MEIIEIKTLVDITCSGQSKFQPGRELEFNQHKNWITLLQCIGLRCIISYDVEPEVEKIDIKNLGFGTKFKGKHNVWTFRFKADRSEAYAGPNGKVEFLINDLNLVPIIGNLSETINNPKAALDTLDSSEKNTTVTFISA